MAIKQMRQRVRDAFADDSTHAYGERYLDLVLQNWREIEAAVRRTATLMVVLILAFFLLIGSDARFDLGPIKLSSGTSALVLLPAVLSFLTYEFVELQWATHRYFAAVSELMRKLHPTVHTNDLHRLLAPPTASLWGDHSWKMLRAVDETRLSRTLRTSGTMLGAALMVGVVGFEIFAYLRLFERQDAGHAAIWISVAFSTLMGLRAVFAFVDELSSNQS